VTTVQQGSAEEERLTIGVDVGGTKIAAAVVDAHGQVRDRVKSATAKDGTAVFEALAAIVTELRDTHDVSGVGVGLPGFVDAGRDELMFAPNLPDLGPRLRQRIQDRVELPVVLENDANAAAWGEFVFGAGHGVDHLLFITVGTGIGGGLVLDGQLCRGAFGVAAEIGHLRLVPDGLPCGCGQCGCWEQYASGSALTRAAARAATSDPRASALVAAVGGDPSLVDGEAVTRAARDGDELARDLLTAMAHHLGVGTAILCGVLDPALVVLGGGVSAVGDLLLRPVQESFQAHLTAHRHRPVAPIRLATLGNDAGLLGAAALARANARAPETLITT